MARRGISKLAVSAALAVIVTGTVRDLGADHLTLDAGREGLLRLGIGDALVEMPARLRRGDRVTVEYVLQALKIEPADSAEEPRQKQLPGRVAPSDEPRENAAPVLDDRAFYTAGNDRVQSPRPAKRAPGA